MTHRQLIVAALIGGCGVGFTAAILEHGGARRPAGAAADLVPVQYKPGEVIVPKYSAGYVGPEGTTEDRLTRIERKLDGIAGQLDVVVKAVEAQQKAEAAAQADDADVLAVLQVCAQCHGAASAASKGNGYAMFDEKGKFTRSSAADLRKQVKRLNSKSPEFMMPPPDHAGKVSPERRAKFTQAALADAAAQDQNGSGK